MRTAVVILILLGWGLAAGQWWAQREVVCDACMPDRLIQAPIPESTTSLTCLTPEERPGWDYWCDNGVVRWEPERVIADIVIEGSWSGPLVISGPYREPLPCMVAEAVPCP